MNTIIIQIIIIQYKYLIIYKFLKFFYQTAATVIPRIAVYKTIKNIVN